MSESRALADILLLIKEIVLQKIINDIDAHIT